MTERRIWTCQHCGTSIYTTKETVYHTCTGNSWVYAQRIQQEADEAAMWVPGCGNG